MRRFILGLGAQKAGTTWLYKQLTSQPHFAEPATKEMHIFDAIHLSHALPFRKLIGKRLAKAITEHPKDYMEQFITRRFHMLLDVNQYYQYFDELIEKDEGFSADITPSYAGLPDDVLGSIKSTFQQRAIRTQVVFLMREPVTRMESSIKMHMRDTKKLERTSVSEMSDRLKTSCGGSRDRIRSSYRETVNRIRSQFDEEDIFFGFYETLFEPAEQQRLSDVLGLDAARFDADTKENSTEKAFRYPRALLDELKGHYEDEYQMAVEDFGLDPSVWDRQLAKITK
ncbi:MAG: sulfotransferase domain-containing protein [Pseudomonadota bacterium]